MILTDQQLLEQLFCAAVGNKPWRTGFFAPSTPNSSHGEKENNRFCATARRPMNGLKKSFCKGEIEMLPNPPATHKDAYQSI